MAAFKAVKWAGAAYSMAGSLAKGGLLTAALVAQVAYGSLCLAGMQGNPENNSVAISWPVGMMGLFLSLAGVACVALYWAQSGRRARGGDAAKGWALFSAAMGLAGYALGRMGVLTIML